MLTSITKAHVEEDEEDEAGDEFLVSFESSRLREKVAKTFSSSLGDSLLAS